nr:glycosyl hydrolase family 18 protein [Clostridium cavendishii]
MMIIPINCTAKAETKGEVDTNSKRIVTYFPEWGIYPGHNGYEVSDIPWDKVTHVNYAFATIKDGKVAIFDNFAATEKSFGEKWDSPYKGNYGQIKKFKQQHPNTKVLISVGGWSQSGGFHDAAATEQSRKVFADSAVEFIRTWGFDGVDIDWEYPTFKRDGDKVDNPNDQGTPKADESEKQTFTLLLKSLRESLDSASKTDNKKYQLTAAVGCGQDKIEKTEPDKYAQYLDFINVMTYDMRGAWENKTGHQSPLYKNPYDPSSPLIKENYNVDAAMKKFESYGISKNKLIVGSPYYSRGWTGVKNDGPIKDLPGLFATATGGAKGIWDGGRAAGNHPFYYLKSTLENDPSFKKYRDPYSKVPYLYSESKGEMYTYEDEISLWEKVSYVKQNNYGGIIAWELSGDYPSKGSTLTDVIYNGFKNNLPPVVDPGKPTDPTSPTDPTNPTDPVKPDANAWVVGKDYKAGDVVSYKGKNYTCLVSHTSLEGWDPVSVASLWK